MMTDRALAATAWAIYLGSIALFSHSLEAAYEWLVGWRKSEGFAAELQAYGALLGLGIAILIPAMQRRHEQRQRSAVAQERRVEQLQTLFFIAASLQEFVRNLAELAASADARTRTVEIDSVQQEDILNRLAAVEVYEVGSGDGPRITAFHIRRLLWQALRQYTVDGRTLRAAAVDERSVRLGNEVMKLYIEARKAHEIAREAFSRDWPGYASGATRN